MQWPMKPFVAFTFTDGKSPKTWERAAASCASPWGVAVACAFTMSMSPGSQPAIFRAARMLSAWRAAFGRTKSVASVLHE